MEKTLSNNWMAVALSVLGVMYPMQFNKEVQALSNPIHALLPSNWTNVIQIETPIAHRIVKSNAFTAPSRDFTYVFAGQATFQGQPLANAKVEIRTTSEYAADSHIITTGPDGRYSLSVPVTGKASETLSWEIHGLTSDLKQANREGHQILTQEHNVKMVVPLHFSEI